MRKSPIVSGIAIAFAGVSLSAQVHLGQVSLGSSNSTPVTLTIASAGTLSSLDVVTGGAANLDFTAASGSTCKIGETYQAKDTCIVRVRFAPKWTGARMGAVSLTDHNGNPMAVVYLAGTGLGPQTGFDPAVKVPVMPDLNNVAQLGADASGNVYVAEQQSYSSAPGAPPIPGGVFKAAPAGAQTYTLSDIGSALLDPVGVAIDGDGNVLEADSLLNPVIDPGQGTTSPVPGFFHEEQGLAVDAQGNIYSAGNGSVYKSSPAFAVDQAYSTVVSGLGYVQSVAVDSEGSIYVPDSGAVPAVYKETPKGSGYVQTLVASGWSHPFAVAVDSNGIVYVNDSGTLYAATPQSSGQYLKSPLLADQISNASPFALAVDGRENLYLSEYAGSGPLGSIYNVYQFDRSSTPKQVFTATPAGSVSKDGPRIVTLSNLGNTTLHIESIDFPGDFEEIKHDSARCKSHAQLDPGETCTITIVFAPQHNPSNGSASEVLNERICIFTDTLNEPGTLQTIELGGAVTRKTTAAPVISRPSGTYDSGQTITLTDATPGAVIYYTVNGKTPTPDTATRYTGPGVLEASGTLRVVAFAPGYLPSIVTAANFRFVAARPTISPAGGSYQSPVKVTITGATPGATLFYTTDGEIPNANSRVYQGPFTIDSSERVIAIAARTGFTPSGPVQQLYNMPAHAK